MSAFHCSGRQKHKQKQKQKHKQKQKQKQKHLLNIVLRFGEACSICKETIEEECRRTFR